MFVYEIHKEYVVHSVSGNARDICELNQHISGLAVGGISALNFANRLSQFVYGLFAASVIAGNTDKSILCIAGYENSGDERDSWSDFEHWS